MDIYGFIFAFYLLFFFCKTPPISYTIRLTNNLFFDKLSNSKIISNIKFYTIHREGKYLMENFWIILRLMASIFCSLALLAIMSGFRSKRSRAFAILTTVAVLCSVFNLYLYFAFGRELMMKVFAVSLAVPTLAVLLFLTNDRPSQILFNFFTCINMLYLAAISSHIIIKSDEVWMDALFRTFVYSVIIFLFWRFLSEPYRFLARNMKKGWGMIAVIPFLFFFLVMFMGLYPEVRNDNFYSVLILYVIMCFVYYIIYQVFRNTYDLLKQDEAKQLLAMQVAAQKNQIAAMEESRSRISLLRHDMRHYAQGIASLLQEGNTQEALRLLENYNERFREIEVVRYCADPLLNAIISHAVTAAQDQGIRVETRISLPEELLVDTAELAIVFSNAIENAIHACAKLPDGADKYILIRCIGTPKLGIEIANTYDGQVQFGSGGLPVTQEPGHGWGTRSISAFAKKYNALLEYEADGHMFRMMLLVQTD